MVFKLKFVGDTFDSRQSFPISRSEKRWQDYKLLADDTISSGMVAYQEPQGTFRYRAWSGYFYVTNQRVFFCMFMTGIAMMELSLSESRGFWISKSLFTPAVTICGKEEETRDLQVYGIQNKKLAVWLEQAGVTML